LVDPAVFVDIFGEFSLIILYQNNCHESVPYVAIMISEDV